MRKTLNTKMNGVGTYKTYYAAICAPVEARVRTPTYKSAGDITRGMVSLGLYLPVSVQVRDAVRQHIWDQLLEPVANRT